MAKDVEQIMMTANVVIEILAWTTSLLALYVTAVSGYLLVAYLLGNQLNRIQVLTFTVLFVLFTVFNTAGTYSGLRAAHEFGSIYGAGRVPEYPAQISVVLMLLGIVAALKFMWDVRHPKE